MTPPSVAEEARLFPQQGNSHLKYAVPKRCPDAFLIDLLAHETDVKFVPICAPRRRDVPRRLMHERFHHEHAVVHGDLEVSAEQAAHFGANVQDLPPTGC